MGFVSDRTKTRMGRRLPYVLFGSIPLAVSFFFVFAPPSFVLAGSGFSKILYYTLSLCVYDFFFTTVLLNWEAVVPAMYPKDGDRGRIIGIAQVASILGGIICAVSVQPLFEAYGWTAMSAIYAVVGGITMIISIFGIRENPKHLEPKPYGVIESFKLTLQSKAFVIGVLSVFFLSVARGLLSAVIPFYGKYVFPEVDGAATYFLALVYIASLAFTPLSIFLGNKAGIKKSYIISLIAFAAVSCGFFLPLPFAAALTLSALLGFGVTGGMIMPKMLSNDIIDEDHTKTGKRREGAFLGAQAFIFRFALAVQTLIMAAVMKVFGYQSTALDDAGNVIEAAAQTPLAISGIRLAMSLIPAVITAIALLIILKYPLEGSRLEAIRLRRAELDKNSGV
jgi:GPH family glycoside/pentoside/hexuronide:cation symporter